MKIKNTAAGRRAFTAPAPERRVREHEETADIPIWKEALFGAELLLLHASPVYYGLGIPRGDNSAVVVIPGFLGSDIYVMHLQSWLERIGYQAYFSGIGVNAECPNLLIQYREGTHEDEPQDPSHRPQSGRNYRTLSCGPAPKGHRFRYYTRCAHPRNSHAPVSPACGKSGSRSNLGPARFGSSTRLLYTTLYLQIFEFTSLHDPRVDHANCHLHEG